MRIGDNVNFLSHNEIAWLTDIVQRRGKMDLTRVHPALALLLAGSVFCIGSAEAGLRLVERERVVLKLRPLTTLQAEGEYELRLPLDQEGHLSMEVRWPDEESLSRIDLRAGQRPRATGQGQTIDLHADVTLPGGAKRQARRTLVFTDSAMELFELLRDQDDRSLVLAVVAEVQSELALPGAGSSGQPIQLLLEIERMEAGEATPLETNQLSTLVGEAVSYSFQIETAHGSESLRLELIPHSISGDLVQIELELSGVLPGPEGPVVIGRKEHWLGSRGASSSISLEAGEPPAGYRFLVTPRF